MASKKQQAIEATYALWTDYEAKHRAGRGTLHGVLDDGNLEDMTLDSYIADFCAALPLLSALRGMSYKDRFDLFEYAQSQYSQRQDAIYEALREAR